MHLLRFPHPLCLAARSPVSRFALASLGFLLSAFAADYYVAPNGSPSGTGQLQNPWNLQTALNHPTMVRPGDTIWVRGGTYPGKYRSVLRGVANQPIIVRQYPGERAVIDANTNTSTPAVLTADGSWTWFWGLEVTNSNPGRRLGSSRPTGIDVFGPNIKIINMVVHDNGSGFGLWNGADDSEIYGTLIYYNGWEGGDRGHGHSIYSQNRLGLKRITDNIYFKSYSHGIHIYGSENAFLENFLIEGNTGFDNGVLSPSSGAKTQFIIGGGVLAKNLTLRDNATFFSGNDGRNEIGYGAGCTNLLAERNYFVAPVAMKLSCTAVTFTGNLFYGGLNGMTAAQFPNNTYTTVQPKGLQVLLRPNRYEPGRGHVTVYNWDNLSNVSVNLASILPTGAAYEIRDAQNFFGPPVASGVYSGGSVTIPMTGTAITPLTGLAEVALLHTPVRFGSFIVLPVSGTVPPPPAPTNLAPVVTTGPAQTITLPASATVTASATDDGLPNGTLSYSWSVTSGPGPVSFTNPASATTGVTFSSAGTYQLRLMASDGQLSSSATTQITVNAAPPPPPPPPGGVLRINAGAGQLSDAAGNLWEADRNFSGGSPFAVTRPVSGPAGIDPYQSVRYGNFTYRFPVANGSYRILLRFAEIYHERAGARLFSVNVNGQAKLSSFDVFAAAGSAFTAVDRQFDVAVSGGEIAIGFVSQIDFALVNAIEIQPLTTTPVPTPPVSVTLSPTAATLASGATRQFSALVANATNSAVTWSLSPALGAISSSGLYQAPTVTSPTGLTVRATSVADPTKSATAQLTIEPVAPPPPPPPPADFSPVRMNAGGPRYVDGVGNTWLSESSVSGGAVFATTAAIANTTDQALYKTVRYGTFRYELPVANGARTVRLRFAEIYFTQTGRRVFNVRINGTQVLTGFDIFAAGGAFSAVDREFPVNVTNGAVVIEFLPVVENPCLGAIEIR
ncbi:MAG: malectin domain-containing carbohydrate-binding protein [Acidobacteria bacterium]|nr:malectin domain-containing carbohydrate-binding protein [Acidobacteriota bacterium]